MPSDLWLDLLAGPRDSQEFSPTPQFKSINSSALSFLHSVVSDPRNPMDCSLPGSFVHGIFQARVLEWGAIAFSILEVYMYRLLCPWDSPGKNIGVEWVAISFFTGSSQPRDLTRVSLIAGRFFIPSLEEFSTVCCDLHSQRLWRNQ